MRRPLRCLLLTSLLSFALSSLPGCGSVERDPNRSSGADATRLGATQIPADRTVIDHVDRPAGDMTDWKYFTIPAQSLVEFAIAFDSMDANGTAIIRDEVGQQVSRLEHRGEPRLQTAFRGNPGVYYVEVFAEGASSSYTMEVHLEPGW